MFTSLDLYFSKNALKRDSYEIAFSVNAIALK